MLLTGARLLNRPLADNNVGTGNVVIPNRFLRMFLVLLNSELAYESHLLIVTPLYKR